VRRNKAGASQERPQRLKPLCQGRGYGTAEAVPLSKTKTNTEISELGFRMTASDMVIIGPDSSA